MADQKLDKLEPDVTVKSLKKKGRYELVTPEKKEGMYQRLRRLVNLDWRSKKIRLIAWSETEKHWILWEHE